MEREYLPIVAFGLRTGKETQLYGVSGFSRTHAYCARGFWVWS